MIATQILIVARDALVLWTKFAVMPAEFMFDAIEAELKRRGIGLDTRSSDDGG
jgi:DNA phosphorothioation-dependent restriction protein DptG